MTAARALAIGPRLSNKTDGYCCTFETIFVRQRNGHAYHSMAAWRKRRMGHNSSK